MISHVEKTNWILKCFYVHALVHSKLIKTCSWLYALFARRHLEKYNDYHHPWTFSGFFMLWRSHRTGNTRRSPGRPFSHQSESESHSSARTATLIDKNSTWNKNITRLTRDRQLISRITVCDGDNLRTDRAQEVYEHVALYTLAIISGKLNRPVFAEKERRRKERGARGIGSLSLVYVCAHDVQDSHPTTNQPSVPCGWARHHGLLPTAPS